MPEPKIKVQNIEMCRGRVRAVRIRPSPIDEAFMAPVVLFLHGMGSSLDAHIDSLCRLGKKTKNIIIAADWIGHGGSDGLGLDTYRNAKYSLAMRSDIVKAYPHVRSAGIKIYTSSYGAFPSALGDAILLKELQEYEKSKDARTLRHYHYARILPQTFLSPPLNLVGAAGDNRRLLKIKYDLANGYLPIEDIAFILDKKIRPKLEGRRIAMNIYDAVYTRLSSMLGLDAPTKEEVDAAKKEMSKQREKSMFAPLLSQWFTGFCLKLIRQKYSNYMPEKVPYYDREYTRRALLSGNKKRKTDLARLFRHDIGDYERSVILERHFLRSDAIEQQSVLVKFGTLRLQSPDGFDKFVGEILNHWELEEVLRQLIDELNGPVPKFIVGTEDKTLGMLDAAGNHDPKKTEEFVRVSRGNIEFTPTGHMSDHKDTVQLEIIENLIVKEMLALNEKTAMELKGDLPAPKQPEAQQIIPEQSDPNS